MPTKTFEQSVLCQACQTLRNAHFPFLMFLYLNYKHFYLKINTAEMSGPVTDKFVRLIS